MKANRLLYVLMLVMSALACSSPRVPADGGSDSPTGPAPTLAKLEVTSSATPSLTLVPPFAPDVYDYYVRCVAGTNSLSVSMTASSGAVCSLTQPTASTASPASEQTLSVSVQESQAIVAAATAGARTTEYWVRCLPADFPPMRMTAHPEAGTAPPGYYLMGNNWQPTSSYGGYAIVLNGKGVPVWYAHGISRPGAAEKWVAWDVDHLSPGTISYYAPYGSPVEIHQLSPLLTTYATPSGIDRDSHELRLLPNGHYLVISAPVQRVDLTGLKVPLPDGGVETFGPKSYIDGCNVAEFDPKTGAIVWTWVALEHLDAVQDSTAPEVNPNSRPNQPVAETFHCNSIDVDEATGNILLSARNMNSVFYIERPSGKILWKIGGAKYTKDGATYVPVNDAFYGQHDARFLPGWSSTCAGGCGQISLFDDHSNEPGPARGVVLDVVVGTTDGGSSADCGTGGRGTPGATVAWQYEGKTSSIGEGSFRILADGSRVIGWGKTSTTGLVFTEVDDKKAALLDFSYTDGDGSYRVIKVPLTTFNLNVLRRTAGLL